MTTLGTLTSPGGVQGQYWQQSQRQQGWQDSVVGATAWQTASKALQQHSRCRPIISTTNLVQTDRSRPKTVIKAAMAVRLNQAAAYWTHWRTTIAERQPGAPKERLSHQ